MQYELAIVCLPQCSICYPSFKFFAQRHVVVGPTIHRCHVPERLIIRTSVVVFAVRSQIFVENVTMWNQATLGPKNQWWQSANQRKQPQIEFRKIGLSSHRWIFWERETWWRIRRDTLCVCVNPVVCGNTESLINSTLMVHFTVLY